MSMLKDAIEKLDNLIGTKKVPKFKITHFALHQIADKLANLENRAVHVDARLKALEGGTGEQKQMHIGDYAAIEARAMLNEDTKARCEIISKAILDELWRQLAALAGLKNLVAPFSLSSVRTEGVQIEGKLDVFGIAEAVNKLFAPATTWVGSASRFPEPRVYAAELIDMLKTEQNVPLSPSFRASLVSVLSDLNFRLSKLERR